MASKGISRRYTAATIDRTLLAVAVHGGSRAQALRMLKAQGHAVPPKATLNDWVERIHRDRYLELQAAHSQQIEDQIVAEHREFIVQAAEVEREALAKTRKELPHLEPRDAAGALRNVSTSKAIAVDKMLALSGRPTQYVEHTANADELLLKVQSILGVVPAIDSTAIEDTEKVDG